MICLNYTHPILIVRSATNWTVLVRMHIIVLLLCVCAGVVHGDHVIPFANCRIVCKDSPYYVVLNLERGGHRVAPIQGYGRTRVAIVQNKSKCAYVKPAITEWYGDKVARSRLNIDRDARVLDGDEIIYQFVLPRPPMQVVFSLKDSAFVFLGCYGPNQEEFLRNEYAILIVSKTGSIRNQVKLGELLTEKQMDTYSRRSTVSKTIDFPEYSWIDEKKQALILVGKRPENNTIPRAMLGVKLSTGAVFDIKNNDIAESLKSTGIGGLYAAIPAAYKICPNDLRNYLLPLVRNEDNPIGIRAMGAAYLEALDEHSGGRLLSSLRQKCRSMIESNPLIGDEISLRPALAMLVGYDMVADEMLAYRYSLRGIEAWEK